MGEEYITITARAPMILDGDIKFARYITKILTEYGIPDDQISREHYDQITFSPFSGKASPNRGVRIKVSDFTLFEMSDGVPMSRDLKDDGYPYRWKRYTSKEELRKDIDQVLLDYCRMIHRNTDQVLNLQQDVDKHYIVL